MGLRLRISAGVSVQGEVRGYGYGKVMVCCGGGIGLVKYGRGCARGGAWVWLWAGDGVLRWRCREVGCGRYVRRRVSEFIGIYRNLSEFIRGNRMGSDKL